MGRKFDRNLLPQAPTLEFEISLWERGTELIAGVDEAGRGALAGPVVAAAAIFRSDPTLTRNLDGVRDSKQMTPEQRAYWSERIQAEALGWSVGFAAHQEIDALGIVPATCLAAQRALEGLQLPAQHLLIDFLKLPDCLIPQTPLVKGDARCFSIAAASILAKTARDAVMVDLDFQYPGYGFASHKGYATAAHYAALARLGPSPVHRKSFRLERERGEGE